MESNFQNVLILMLISTVLSEPPVYSANYANIRYQPSEDWKSHYDKLNLDERHREEVTEKSPQTRGTSFQTATSNGLSESYDTTTEPESEQINLARFVYRNIVKDKLVEGSENIPTNIFDENNTTDLTQEKEVTNDNDNDENVVISRRTTSSSKEKFAKEDEEVLDDLYTSEVSDLNQDVYYIYHPDLLLQKVVYRTQANPSNMEFPTQLNSENIAPIVEPIYTYDPRTFVLQRLILRPMGQTYHPNIQ